MSMAASILITGGTSGLGYHAAQSFAKEFPSHRIILASRTNPHNAAETINQHLHQENIEYRPLDLSSLSSVRAFVREWTENKYPPIQYLLLNAGLQTSAPVQYTEDGFEKTFAVNHLGHALLLSLLIPSLDNNARIILTTSANHDPETIFQGSEAARYTSIEEMARPEPDTKYEGVTYPGRLRYANSKLVSLLWMYALERRLKALREAKKRNWTVAAYSPGMATGTGIVREEGAVLVFMFVYLMPLLVPLLRVLMGRTDIWTVEVAGEMFARVAVDGTEDASGKYYEGDKVRKSSQASYDEGKQEEVWRWTVDTLAEGEERKVFSLDI
ncbi:hypothetical protein BDV18DRAFT_163991 [Aspergillus unguis]